MGGQEELVMLFCNEPIFSCLISLYYNRPVSYFLASFSCTVMDQLFVSKNNYVVSLLYMYLFIGTFVTSEDEHM